MSLLAFLLAAVLTMMLMRDKFLNHVITLIVVAMGLGYALQHFEQLGGWLIVHAVLFAIVAIVLVVLKGKRVHERLVEGAREHQRQAAARERQRQQEEQERQRAEAPRQRRHREQERQEQEQRRRQEEQDSRRNSSPGKLSAAQALDIFGLTGEATEQEIRAAYNRLMKRLHPDVGGSDFLAKQLNAARDVLLG